jgi:hypothetical protein
MSDTEKEDVKSDVVGEAILHGFKTGTLSEGYEGFFIYSVEDRKQPEDMERRPFKWNADTVLARLHGLTVHEKWTHNQGKWQKEKVWN